MNNSLPVLDYLYSRKNSDEPHPHPQRHCLAQLSTQVYSPIIHGLQLE